MNIPIQVDIESLCQTYIVSNTPRYLYKHLRSNPSVQWMANSLSIDQLTAIYAESQQESERSVNEVVVAHAVLAAFSHMSYGDIAPVLDRLPTTGLKWASEMIDILKKTRKIIVTVSMEIPKNWEIVSSKTSTASINVTKPIIEIVRS
jgi:hypothetical protein